MTVFYLVIVGSMVLLGGSALAALFWAARQGQFRRLDKGATSIFDADEPVGKPTDVFPGMDLEEEKRKKLLKAKRKK